MYLYIDASFGEMTKFDRQKASFSINLHSDIGCVSTKQLRLLGLGINGYQSPANTPVYLVMDGIVGNYLNNMPWPILAKISPNDTSYVKCDHTVEVVCGPIRNLNFSLRTKYGPALLDESFTFHCLFEILC